MLKKTLISGIVFSSVLTISLLGFHQYTKPDEVIKVSTMNADYKTVEKLTKESPVIVKGKIESNGNTKVHLTSQDDGEEDSKLYYTNKIFKVQQVYKGDNIKSGDRILVRTYDAQKDGVIAVSEATVKKNESYVLFLKESVYPKKDGAYAFVGGTQAIFKLNGKDGIQNKRFTEIKKLSILEEKINKNKSPK